jgi:predicted site-specific integrase-resolvase
MCNIELLKPREVDLLLRYPPGRTAKLARAGRIPFIRLPDGEIRIDADEIKRLLVTAAEGEKAHA